MMRRSGFSLIELAMVLVLSGLMVGFVLKAPNLSASNGAGGNGSTGGAGGAGGSTGGGAGNYGCTKERMLTIRDAMEAFARNNNRLPLPAARNIGVDNVNYGREVTLAADYDTSGGVSMGALPFQALGLSSIYAGDCWGNKFSYKVTTALTTSAVSGGYLDTAVNGNITLKSTTANNINTNTAYVIISHGEDAIGAVKLNYSAANPAHGWYAAPPADLKYVNGSVNATAADSAFNNGSGAGANYYDDIVVSAAKATVGVAAPTVYRTYLWGENTWGQMGKGTYDTAHELSPKLAPLPGGVTSYSAISSQSFNSCAIGNDGKAYCWGPNWDYTHGCGGGCGDHGAVPAAGSPVTFPVGVTAWNQISVGERVACGIGNNNVTYCWGNNLSGGINAGIGDGTALAQSVPTAISLPYVGAYFNSVVAGEGTMCGIADNGRVYCWGFNNRGEIGNNTSTGDGSPVVLTPTSVTMPAGVTSFGKLAGGFAHFCAIANAGANSGRAYCWGINYHYQVAAGSGPNIGLNGGGGAWTHGTYIDFIRVPTIVPQGGTTTSYTDIAIALCSSCAIGNDGKSYCWGLNNSGEAGDGNDLTINSGVVATTMPVGVTFTKLWVGGGVQTACAIGSDGALYCWGADNKGQMGNGGGSSANVKVPTAVSFAGVPGPVPTSIDRVVLGAATVAVQTSH
ncbi:MAG: prepilin-type N-terminal cleavage/methylation domain-containing protein [Rickettsiales bacterium]